MYISEDCNWTSYGTDPGLDKQVDSDDVEVRKAVARQGYGLDKLIDDKSWEVRRYVAKQGYGLDKLVYDKNEVVRWEVAQQGYSLDILINDPEEDVRAAVAKHGYGLDKLINDKDCAVREIVVDQDYGLDILVNDDNWYIRREVARKGYGLDKLIHDKDKVVRAVVKDYLKDHNLSLNQWITQNPDKCALDQNECLIEKVTKNFIYKINDSNKLEVQTQYDSIDEFFDSDIEDDFKMNTLIIYSIDTKIPLFKIEKIEVNEEINYKFIIDITNETDNFSIKSIIQSQEQLNKLIEQTIDALNSYPRFVKYADDLTNCL